MPTASCHCTSVRIELDSAPTDLNACQCSLCRRYAVLWAYYRPDQVRLLHVPDATEAYAWGERNLEFHRCRSCGCVTHWTETAPGATRLGVNARLLDPADIAGVPVRHSPGPP